MQKNINRYDYQDEQEDFYEKEVAGAIKEKVKGYTGTPLLIIIQIIVCTLIIISVVVLKSIGGDIYNRLNNWYVTKLNESILVGDDMDTYKLSWNNMINKDLIDKAKEAISSNIGGKDKDIENIVFNNDNSNTKCLPVCLSVPITLPVKSGLVTSEFGSRKDPITGKQCNHNGLDIGTDKDSIIYATMPGKVEKAEESNSYGKYVILDHGNGIKTLYAHCNRIIVKAGDTVKRGQKIAYVGSTGKATGNHLHFEIIIDGKKYDPKLMLNGEYKNAV